MKQGFLILAVLVGCAASAWSAEPVPAPETLVKPADTLSAPPDAVPATSVPPTAVTGISLADKPNDDGRSIVITWNKSADDSGLAGNTIKGYKISRGTLPSGPFEILKTESGEDMQLKAGAETYTDKFDAAAANVWWYQVVAVGTGDLGAAAVSRDGLKAQWSIFDGTKTEVLVMLLIITCMSLFFYSRATRNPEAMYVRRIPGIDAIEEAIGRATEMGRPVLYVPGIMDQSNIQTIASLIILGEVSKKIAEYEAKIIVPTNDPMVREIAADVVKQAYYSAGNPDAFDPKNVRFVTMDQFAFVANVNGIMLRDKPAANIYLGCFLAESLLLAETGFQAGAIQVAGTAEVSQLPFFVAACDYTLIGEELYAASVYLSRRPNLMATLKASDWIKVMFLAASLVGTVGLTLFKSPWIQNLLDINR